MDDEVLGIACATYTHARRHPIVVGQIGGWAMPVQLTLTQIGIVLVLYLVEVKTWGLWARLLPTPLALLLAVTVPVGAAWLLRRVRIEGRSIPRAALGWLSLLSVPSGGTLLGNRYRQAPAADLRRTRTYVAPGDPRP